MTTYTLNDGSLLAWATVTYHRDGDTSDMRTGLRWSPEEPYAVSVEFIHRLSEPVVWVLSRDTLTDGLHCVTGCGDYQVYPVSPTWVGLYLTSPSGSATFSLETDVLRDFLAATFHLVPAGREYAGWDVDSELAFLLEEESA
jgi:hypothetical protein